MPSSPAAQIVAPPSSKLSTFALLKKSKIITVGAVIVLTCLLCAGSIQVYLYIMDAHILQLAPKASTNRIKPKPTPVQPKNPTPVAVDSSSDAESNEQDEQEEQAQEENPSPVPSPTPTPTPVQPSKPSTPRKSFIKPIRRIEIIRKKIKTKKPAKNTVSTDFQPISPPSSHEDVGMVASSDSVSQQTPLQEEIENVPEASTVTSNQSDPKRSILPDISTWTTDAVDYIIRKLFRVQKDKTEAVVEVQSIEIASDGVEERGDVLIIKKLSPPIIHRVVRSLKKVSYLDMTSDEIFQCLFGIFTFAQNAIPSDVLPSNISKLLSDSIERSKEALTTGLTKQISTTDEESSAEEPIDLAIGELLDFWNDRFIPALLLDASFRTWSQSISNDQIAGGEEKQLAKEEHFLTPIEWLKFKNGPISTAHSDRSEVQFYVSLVEEIYRLQRTFAETLKNPTTYHHPKSSMYIRFQPFNQGVISISGPEQDKYIICYYNDLLTRLAPVTGK